MSKKIFKNGFNLLDAYPIEFSGTVETIESGGDECPFVYQFPENKIENIIVNLCPTGPWDLPNSAVLEYGIRDFLKKFDTVRAKYFPDAHCHLAINTQATNIINESKRYKDQAVNVLASPPFDKGECLHVHALDPIYPNDAPVMIVKSILGFDVLYGRNTEEIGVIVFLPQTIVKIYEHYIDKSCPSTRLLPISGTALCENKIIKVGPGTSIKDVLEGNIKDNMKFVVIIDGPFNGFEVKDLSYKISWTTKNIVVLEDKDYKIAFPFAKVNELLFTTSLIGELRRCVYCNFCDDICPVNLEPALFWHCHERGEKHKARLYELEKCIECGLCSFICPSKLEVFEVIKECKST